MLLLAPQLIEPVTARGHDHHTAVAGPAKTVSLPRGPSYSSIRTHRAGLIGWQRSTQVPRPPCRQGVAVPSGGRHATTRPGADAVFRSSATAPSKQPKEHHRSRPVPKGECAGVIPHGRGKKRSPHQGQPAAPPIVASPGPTVHRRDASPPRRQPRQRRHSLARSAKTPTPAAATPPPVVASRVPTMHGRSRHVTCPTPEAPRLPPLDADGSYSSHTHTHT